MLIICLASCKQGDRQNSYNSDSTALEQPQNSLGTESEDICDTRPHPKEVIYFDSTGKQTADTTIMEAKVTLTHLGSTTIGNKQFKTKHMRRVFQAAISVHYHSELIFFNEHDTLTYDMGTVTELPSCITDEYVYFKDRNCKYPVSELERDMANDVICIDCYGEIGCFVCHGCILDRENSKVRE